MPERAESQVTLTSSYGAVGTNFDINMHKVPWWSRRTSMERKFVVLAGVLGVLVVCIGVGLLLMVRGHRLMDSKHMEDATNVDINLSSNNSESTDKLKLCLSKGCIQAAADVLDKLDDTVDPCDDFYQFACGGFIKKTVIPDDHTKVSMFSVIGDKLDEQVRGLLDIEIEASDPKPFRLAKSLFQSCMNRSAIEEKGVAPLTSALKTMGGWPLLEGDSWDQEGFKWFDMVYKFRDMGYSVDYLVDFSVTTDLKNSSWRILDLDQPGLGMSREYLMKGLEDKDVLAYFNYMKDVAILLGADKATSDKQMLETLKFEIQLANMSLPREDRRDANKMYNPRPVSQLTELDPNTPWLEYINNVLSEARGHVEDSETIIVEVPSYLKQLSELLTVTPARVQANYLMWRAAASSMSYLTEEADKIRLKFSKTLTGQSEQPPRWKICVKETSESLPNAVGSLYVSKYFNEKSKTTALEMVTEIRNQFEVLLDQVDWMDDETREKAKEKARSMEAHIGYPSELLDMSKLEEFYAGLELGDSDYFGNSLNLAVFGTNYSFSQLREKVNKTDWVHHGRPAVVNAFYSPLENSIQFPAGILQGVFFSNDRPLYMNYGAIGWVIGHEITHGFDDQGKQFDKEGNLVDWWQAETKNRYLTRAKCIIDQYSKYSIAGTDGGSDRVSVNGVNTQGENIADNGGIKEAYRAYDSWVSKNGPELLLPGLPYSGKQMFWISAANVWCSKYRPQALKMLVKTGVHSPSQFRVQGPFSNMNDFAKDFNCPVGSNMNPAMKEKCKVW